jgi:hypothetical protein
MRELEPVDLSFLDAAPHRAVVSARVAGPRARVFAAVATDPAGWGDWFPGFSHAGSWRTPAPHGVGSVRTVTAFGTRYRETVLAWNEGERWAFRVDAASFPAFRAFAEDYHFADDGPEGTLLTYTVAARLTLPLRPAWPLAPVLFRAIIGRAARRLGRLTTTATTT